MDPERPIFNSLRVASDFGELRLVFVCLTMLDVFRLSLSYPEQTSTSGDILYFRNVSSF